jgi:hypothetical protein
MSCETKSSRTSRSEEGNSTAVEEEGKKERQKEGKLKDEVEEGRDSIYLYTMTIQVLLAGRLRDRCRDGRKRDAERHSR